MRIAVSCGSTCSSSSRTNYFCESRSSSTFGAAPFGQAIPLKASRLPETLSLSLSLFLSFVISGILPSLLLPFAARSRR